MTQTIDVDTVVADSSGGLVAAACLFHGFSDPTRLAILRHLALGEHRVVDLTRHVGLAQSTVSKHLACLRDCGLVSARPEGRATVYSLNHTAELDELWRCAERLLELTGEQVTLCGNYGHATLPVAAPPSTAAAASCSGAEGVAR